MQRVFLASITLLLALGCSSADGDGDNGDDPTADIDDSGDGEVGDSDNGPYSTLTWSFSDIEVHDLNHRPGYQGKLLRASDGTLYHAALKYMGSYDQDGQSNTCDIAVFGGGAAPTSQYHIRFAIRAPGAESWTVETIPLENVPAADNQGFVGTLYGLDATLDGSGRPVLAFAAGGPGVATCASSDLVIATRASDGTWSFEAPVTDSAACCSVDECGGEPACNQGTDVGAWATITSRASGGLAAAYVDYHFFWDQDGQTHQGYELWQPSGVTGIRPWSGMGIYGDLIEVDGALVAAFTSFNAGGLHLLRQESDGGIDSWVGNDVLPGWQVGERLSMALSPSDGTLGLAAYATTNASDIRVDDLLYCTSSDGGATWSIPCERVDEGALALGEHPSLAYDSAGRAFISYYLCGATGSCGASEDGLRLAWRADANDWRVITIDNNAATRAGTFSQVVIDPVTDEPTVVYQDLTRAAVVAAQGHL